MKYQQFIDKVKMNLSAYKLDKLKIEEKGIYIYKENIKEIDHILPLRLIEENLIGPYKKYPEMNHIKLHQYAHHLNSSQIMAINFFAPLNEKRDIFAKLIVDLLGIEFLQNDQIIQVEFEHIENAVEKTNFDLFVKFSSGFQIFFEIKYTENGFNKRQSSTHPKDRWDRVYQPLLQKSKYLSNASFDDMMWNHFQINRNILYITKENFDYTYVVFVTCKENESTRKDIEQLPSMEHVKSIFWNELYAKLLPYLNNDLIIHYEEFYQKYLLFK